MEKRQNIWVDGSLRDANYYQTVFRRIRQTHPHYRALSQTSMQMLAVSLMSAIRISIFYINASEQAIRQRIKIRAEQTGRDVPEHLIVASLQAAMDKSLNTLTPLCDFVARINNEGHEPTLVAFETVDTKGNWRIISDRTYYDPTAFPQSKPTQRLSVLPARLHSLFVHSQGEKLVTLSLDSHAKVAAEIFGSSILLTTSQSFDLPWHPHANLPIPKEATKAVWIYPCRTLAESFSRHLARCDAMKDLELKLLGHLMLYGAFAFYTAEGSLSGVLSVTTMDSGSRLQFGKPITLKPASIEAQRFQDIVSPYFLKQGALKVCWLSPGEKIDGLEDCSEGAFAYLMDDDCSILAFRVV
eukprot:Skav225009  [mRNA]  locus=scaffold957:142168:145084:+ [translate_table: standard]